MPTRDARARAKIRWSRNRRCEVLMSLYFFNSSSFLIHSDFLKISFPIFTFFPANILIKSLYMLYYPPPLPPPKISSSAKIFYFSVTSFLIPFSSPSDITKSFPTFFILPFFFPSSSSNKFQPPTIYMFHFLFHEIFNPSLKLLSFFS